MKLGAAVKRVVLGPRDRIASTVYGAIVVMGAITAGSGGQSDPARLASIVFATVFVLWIAHVYSHGLAESIDRRHRLDGAELVSVARREFSLLFAAVAPIGALLLGAVGVVRESRAVWLALGLGVATLVVQGLRYARLEHVGRLGALVAVAVNVAVGLFIVGLKAFVAH